MASRSDDVVASILAINDRDLDATWIGDDRTTLEEMGTGEVVGGKEEWIEYLQEWYRGFPDGRVARSEERRVGKECRL